MVRDLSGSRASRVISALLASALLLLEELASMDECSILAGGGAGELVGDLDESLTEEGGWVVDARRPIARVVLGLGVERFRDVAAVPSTAVHVLLDDIDERSEMLSSVEPVGSLKELRGYFLGFECARPVFDMGGAPEGRRRARLRALG